MSANVVSPKILLIVSPNYSIGMLQEEIRNIQTSAGDFTKSVDWRIAAPLGILYIAGMMKEAGYDVTLYDFHRAFYECREKGYFKKNNLETFFREYFDSVLEKGAFDIIGISCLFNVASSAVEEMGRRCRKIYPRARIVVGGHYPTNRYADMLDKGICDYVILGEAEEAFVWLLENFRGPSFDKKVFDHPHIVDLACKNNSNKRPALIENLDSLPSPAWGLLPFCQDYIKKSSHAQRTGTSMGKHINAAQIITTRGCPLRCTFCAAHSVHGRRIRYHSIGYMMKHIDWLVAHYDIDHLLIEDDMFNFSHKRTVEFCNALSEKYPGRFTVEFPNGLAVWTLNKEVLLALKKIGLRNVTIAIESGNQYVQKNILKKNLNLSIVKEKIGLLKKHNVGVRAFYIIGFVGETVEMMQDTVRFALDLNIDWSEIKIFTPLVGSEMGDFAYKKGYVNVDTSEHVYRRCSIRTKEFTPQQVEAIHYDANIKINFINNRNLREGRFEVAEGVFSKILDVYPDHLFAQWGLWKALEGQGRKRDAGSALEKLQVMSQDSKENSLLLKKYGISLPKGDS